MSVTLNDDQLTGLDESHLVLLPDGHRLHGEAAEAFQALQRDAADAGFELVIASSYRSFSRQLGIWNGKARGERPVYDDNHREIPISTLSSDEALAAIMRFSAAPGASRHHWGTDLDVYDSRAMPEGYALQLSPGEVAAGGLFDALHCWLDERMASGESHGFYRPYDKDRGGVSPERWHLSYAPLSRSCGQRLNCDLLMAAWDAAKTEEDIQLRDVLVQQLPAIFERFVAVPPDWCESSAR